MKKSISMIFILAFIFITNANASLSEVALEDVTKSDIRLKRPDGVGINITRMHYRSIPSTQIKARQLGDDICSGKQKITFDEWLLITAEEQTSGIATGNKSWVSPPLYNIYATFCLLWPKNKILFKHTMDQIVTFSVTETVEELGFKPQIKWVNDLLLNGKKLCGVLCENKGDVGNDSHDLYLIGVGLNVNMPQEFVQDLNQPVTSLFIESKKKWDKEKILFSLSANMLKNLHILENLGFTHLHPKFFEKLALIDQTIKVQVEQDVLEGIFKGVNENGMMILMQDDQNKILEDCRILKQTIK